MKKYLVFSLLPWITLLSAPSDVSAALSKAEAIEQAIELLRSVNINNLQDETLLCRCNEDGDNSALRRNDVDSPAFQQKSLEVEYEYLSRHLEDTYEVEEYYDRHSSWFYLWNTLGALFCVICSALASGLTIGLLALDPVMLLMKSRAAKTPKEKTQAESLLQVTQQHHLLLVTLLLCNTASSEALPILLHGIVPEFVAVLLSVVFVLIFGEILPSAFFTGRDQMRKSASWVPVVRFLLWICYPIAYPIAKILDWIVASDDGHGTAVYSRNELAALIRVQYEQRLATKGQQKQMVLEAISEDKEQEEQDQQPSEEEPQKSTRNLRNHHRRSSSLHLEEVAMLEGALQLRTKFAVDLVVSRHKVFGLDVNTTLNQAAIVRMYSAGYSRIPIYEDRNPTRIRGIFMTRQLILIKPPSSPKEALPKIGDFPLHVPHCVGPDTNLVDLVHLLQTGGGGGTGLLQRRAVGHMALVCARPKVASKALEQEQAVPETAGYIGIITLEDVLEALLQEPIEDEMDAAGRIVQASSTSADEDGTQYRELA